MPKSIKKCKATGQEFVSFTSTEPDLSKSFQFPIFLAELVHKKKLNVRIAEERNAFSLIVEYHNPWRKYNFRFDKRGCFIGVDSGSGVVISGLGGNGCGGGFTLT